MTPPQQADALRYRITVHVFACALAGAQLIASTMSYAASEWTKDPYASLRLLNCGLTQDANVCASRIAALEMKLKPGWKTYWRAPGDSGVPPRFDFSKSENVADVAVLWPAPLVFADGNGGKSIGYHESLILPMRVTLKDPRAKATLRAAIQYGVCEKLCVPGEASLEIGLDAPASNDSHLIAGALKEVPRSLNFETSSVRAISRDSDGKRVFLDIATDAAPDAVLVEGPTPDWALPIPTPVDGAPGGMRRFVFSLDGAPPGQTYENVALRITILSAGRHEETQINLK